MLNSVSCWNNEMLGSVSDNPMVLRHKESNWQSHFPFLSPSTSHSGQLSVCTDTVNNSNLRAWTKTVCSFHFLHVRYRIAVQDLHKHWEEIVWKSDHSYETRNNTWVCATACLQSSRAFVLSLWGSGRTEFHSAPTCSCTMAAQSWVIQKQNPNHFTRVFFSSIPSRTCKSCFFRVPSW